jgi:hypothetical protein
VVLLSTTRYDLQHTMQVAECPHWALSHSPEQEPSSLQMQSDLGMHVRSIVSG